MAETDLLGSGGIDFEGSGTKKIFCDSGDIKLVDDNSTDERTLLEIRNRKRITQTSHGLTLPAHGFLPLYYNAVTGDYEEAQADEVNTAADVLAVGFPDANTIEFQEGGLLYVTHGLTVGKWYVLSPSTAGGILPYDTVTGSDAKVQYLAFMLDADTVVIRVDPIFIEPFIPQDIEILEDWTQGAQPVTVSAGDDRILLVSVSWEDQSGSTLISAMTVGGQAGTLMAEQTIVSGIQAGTSVYYWNEAEIAAMSGTTLSLTWTSGAPTFFQTASALIENVDQTSPVVAVNSDSGTGGTDTLDADVNTIAGGYALQVVSGGNGGMGFTNNGSGWSRKLNLTITSADGVVDDKLISSSATPENVNMSITGSNRHVMAAGSFRRRES